MSRLRFYQDSIQISKNLFLTQKISFTIYLSYYCFIHYIFIIFYFNTIPCYITTVNINSVSINSLTCQSVFDGRDLSLSTNHVIRVLPFYFRQSETWRTWS